MRIQIANAFPEKVQNQCLEVQTTQEFHIYDTDEGKSKICENNEPIHFSVMNPNGKSISFLAIDKCLFSDEEDQKRCDCALFDDSTFCFVEIKTGMGSLSTLKVYRKNAREQLLKTIAYFKQRINFDNFQIEAYIAVGRENTPTLPKVLATDLNTQVKFDMIGASFYKGSVKTFE